MNRSTLITIPLPPQVAYAILLAVGLAALSALVYAVLAAQGKKPLRLFGDLGAGWEAPLVTLALIWVVIFFGTLSSLWQVFNGADTPVGSSGGSFGLGTLIVAFLGAPFLIWSTIIKQKTVNIAAEALFNEKINVAANSLAARHQVSERTTDTDGQTAILIEWKDDIVTRAAAIDRLEGLVLEQPGAAPRIANLLSIYVRQLSEEYPAQDAPKDPDILADWARGLRPIRADMEKAAQTLGRLKTLPKVEVARIRIDLRGANLQGFDLHGLTFDRALLSGAWMQGTNLWDARMQGADLSDAQMQGADLSVAQMQGANLSVAQMQGANLSGARMQGADLSGAWMQGAALWDARMQGANLNQARMDAATFLEGTKLSRAAAHKVDLSSVPISADQINSMFGDASVILPPGMNRPAHWPTWKLDWLSFQIEWHKWQAGPTTYTPPPPAAP